MQAQKCQAIAVSPSGPQHSTHMYEPLQCEALWICKNTEGTSRKDSSKQIVCYDYRSYVIKISNNAKTSGILIYSITSFVCDNHFNKKHTHTHTHAYNNFYIWAHILRFNFIQNYQIKIMNSLNMNFCTVLDHILHINFLCALVLAYFSDLYTTSHFLTLIPIKQSGGVHRTC
jgi:hypothetical protein